MIARLPGHPNESATPGDAELARIHRSIVWLAIAGVLSIVAIRVAVILEFPLVFRGIFEVGAMACFLTATIFVSRLGGMPRAASLAVVGGMILVALASILRVIERGLDTLPQQYQAAARLVDEAQVYLNSAGAAVVLSTLNLALFQTYANRTRLIRQSEREKQLVEEKLHEVSDALVRQTRLATIGHISENVAHDLRNPLGAIQIACVYLDRHVPPEHEKWREYLELISREVKNADRIITNLTQIGKGEGPVKVDVGLRLLIQKANAAAHGEESLRAKRWRCEVDGDVETVVGDAAQLKQVFANLIVNTAAATRNSEGETVITIHGRRNGDNDEIVVIDPDSGAPEAARERMDLGISIARHIVEMHGGSIEVSESGARVRLPRA